MQKAIILHPLNNRKNMEAGETGSVAHDMPTTSIEMNNGSKMHEVSVGATSSIKKGDSKKFYNLYNYILALATMKTGPPTD